MLATLEKCLRSRKWAHMTGFAIKIGNISDRSYLQKPRNASPECELKSSSCCPETSYIHNIPVSVSVLASNAISMRTSRPSDIRCIVWFSRLFSRGRRSGIAVGGSEHQDIDTTPNDGLRLIPSMPLWNLTGRVENRFVYFLSRMSAK